MGLSLMQALQALHKQADTNHDNKISATDFGVFLDMVNRIKGPVNCGKNKDCGKCTAVGNAGLCGWFKQSNNNSPFGGYMAKGVCKFVDRTKSSANNQDAKALTTCFTQCKSKGKKTQYAGT